VAWVHDGNAALFTDLYEITMAAAYFADGLDHEATFELWVRTQPPDRDFLVAAGLDTALHYLETLHFDDAALDYLRTIRRFGEDFLERLSDLRFSGDVDAMPEGTVAFAGEPLMRVTAPLIEAQLVETFLLNAVGFQTMIASKAARVRLACDGRRFVDFGGRRSHGADAGLKGARAAYIGGASSTSLVVAGLEYGIPVSGTMAHSFVLAHPDEATAFEAFARVFPEDEIVLLIDTYDTVEGARIAAAVIERLAGDGITVAGVRLDSGDVADLSRRVRDILDDAGLHDVAVLASGGIEEGAIARLVADGAPIDGFGVGTALATSEDAPSLDIIYKLVADRGRPRMKTSTGKVTMPGVKQVFRGPDGDVVGLADETIDGLQPLLEPVMRRGRRTAPAPDLAEVRARALATVDALPPRLKGILEPAEQPWPVRHSERLVSLAEDVRAGR
jgi:nicotinate phosphoribosyltransferase